MAQNSFITALKRIFNPFGSIIQNERAIKEKDNGNPQPLLDNGWNPSSTPGASFLNGLFGTNINFGGLVDSLVNRISAEHLTGAEREQNAFNAEQAQIDRDFQERMSSTQYQRAVSDMRSAGVNPALAMSNGGNAAPSGAMASGSGSGAFSQSMSDLMQLVMLKPQIELMRKQGDAALLHGEAAKETAAAATKNASTGVERLRTVEQPLAENQIRVGNSTVALNRSRVNQISKEIEQLSEDIELTRLHEIATSLDIQWKASTWEDNKRLLVAQIAKTISAAALDRAAATENLSLAALHGIDKDIKEKDKFVANAIKGYLESLPGDGWIQSEINGTKSWPSLLHGYGTGLLDGIVNDFKEDYGPWTWHRFVHGDHGGSR